MIYNNIEDTIGNTPLLKINAEKYGIQNTDVYVKLEYLNPFGSIKDRSVIGMLNKDTLTRLQQDGTSLIESSSGNSAKSIQVLANKYGLPFTSVTNRIKIPEVDQLLRYLGTEVISLPGRSECSDPNDPDDAIGTINRMVAKEPNKYHHTSQYTNTANTAIHEHTTAQELYTDLDEIDIVVTGIGTGGSSGGMIEYAKHHNLSTKHIGVVAHPSDFLPGIRTYTELFETQLFHKEDFEDILEITSRHALESLHELVRNEGVLAGPTTGANFAAVIRYLQEHDTKRPDGSKQTLVFMACDRLETYMSYIMKRQPELFNLETKTYIYNVELNDQELELLEKPADIETLSWIQKNDVLLIDTRGVKPYNNFHIEGSINYPEDVLREILGSDVPFSNKRPVLFVCPTGERSQLLAGAVSRMGLTAYSLTGGLLAWRNADLPFVRKKLI